MALVAFAPPEGLAFCWNPGAGAFDAVGIDAWIAGAFAAHRWTGWYCYNDEPPNAASGSRGAAARWGGCKGVVLWTDSNVGWLVHTVPRWPARTPLETLPAFDRLHVFAWWTGEISRLPKIESQVDLMAARVYVGARSSIHSIPADPTLQRVILDSSTDHIAKNRLWGRDMFGSIGRCRLAGVVAIGADFVCVADFDRDPSHWGRGGGALVMRDPALVLAVRSLLH